MIIIMFFVISTDIQHRSTGRWTVSSQSARLKEPKLRGRADKLRVGGEGGVSAKRAESVAWCIKAGGVITECAVPLKPLNSHLQRLQSPPVPPPRHPPNPRSPSRSAEATSRRSNKKPSYIFTQMGGEKLSTVGSVAQICRR